jgi:hypothetical protein
MNFNAIRGIYGLEPLMSISIEEISPNCVHFAHPYACFLAAFSSFYACLSALLFTANFYL